MLPTAVTGRVEALVGPTREVVPLAGLSGRTVVAVTGTRGTVVVKGPVPAAERWVAEHLAEVLAEHGVRTAACLAVVVADGPWLVLEHVPDALPRGRWGADPATVATLRHLHGLPAGLLDGLADRYRPRWDDATTAAATTRLGLVPGSLSALQRRSHPLFAEQGVVSADPNPLNWRLARVGDPVLVDWERVTLAAPEVDLAILLPGLPTRADADTVVAAYGSGDVDLVLLAKLWSVVELAAAGSAPEVVAQVAPTVWPWLDRVGLR